MFDIDEHCKERHRAEDILVRLDAVRRSIEQRVENYLLDTGAKVKYEGRRFP